MDAITLHNAFTVVQDLRYLDPGTKGRAKWSGSPARCWLSATEDGETIHDDLLQDLTEVAQGRYSHTYPSSVIDAHLADYVGTAVYLIVQAGPADEYKGSKAFVVQQTREI